MQVSDCCVSLCRTQILSYVGLRTDLHDASWLCHPLSWLHSRKECEEHPPQECAGRVRGCDRVVLRWLRPRLRRGQWRQRSVQRCLA